MWEPELSLWRYETWKRALLESIIVPTCSNWCQVQSFGPTSCHNELHPISSILCSYSMPSTEYEQRMVSMGWSECDKTWGHMIERDLSCTGRSSTIAPFSTIFNPCLSSSCYCFLISSYVFFTVVFPFLPISICYTWVKGLSETISLHPRGRGCSWATKYHLATVLAQKDRSFASLADRLQVELSSLATPFTRSSRIQSLVESGGSFVIHSPVITCISKIKKRSWNKITLLCIERFFWKVLFNRIKLYLIILNFIYIVNNKIQIQSIILTYWDIRQTK